PLLDDAGACCLPAVCCRRTIGHAINQSSVKRPGKPPRYQECGQSMRPSERYLASEGVISGPPNIYLRFKGLALLDIRGIA
ncbi:hypothetical protein, partial [Bifidobacterium bifidum]|uniref:hypothetical protein n=1 Tax=Bifidobacterium bifidum TaxID=1681 RepID=UPI00321924AF